MDTGRVSARSSSCGSQKTEKNLRLLSHRRACHDLTILFFSIFFCLVSKKTGLAHYGYIDSSPDSVQPNILEYTISIQCCCIVHLHTAVTIQFCDCMAFSSKIHLAGSHPRHVKYNVYSWKSWIEYNSKYGRACFELRFANQVIRV